MFHFSNPTFPIILIPSLPLKAHVIRSSPTRCNKVNVTGETFLDPTHRYRFPEKWTLKIRSNKAWHLFGAT